MTTIRGAGDSPSNTYGSPHSRSAPEGRVPVPFQVIGRTPYGIAPEDPTTAPFGVTYEATRPTPRSQAAWANTNAPSPGATSANDVYRQYRVPGPLWLADALAALKTVDDEIVEEHLPTINDATKAEAERLIRALARHPRAPTVYPTQDAEIAVHFKSLNLPDTVVILLNDSGRADCYAYTDGRSRRAHYDTSGDLPDDFVLEQLRRLMPKRVDTPVRSQAAGLSSMIFVPGSPLTWWNRGLSGIAGPGAPADEA